VEVLQLAPGLWRWSAPHPEWRPGEGWEPEVACYYAETDDATILVDPQLPGGEDEERFWRNLDDDVAERGRPVAVLLTTPYHRRSADVVAARDDARVHDGARRGDELPGGAEVLEPCDGASPLWLPSHGAIAAGDVLITVGGELRVWWVFHGPDDERDFQERWLPFLRGWLDLPVEHVLVGHGPHVAGGREALAGALEREPYQHA
jgi:hypothetical protein